MLQYGVVLAYIFYAQVVFIWWYHIQSYVAQCL